MVSVMNNDSSESELDRKSAVEETQSESRVSERPEESAVSAMEVDLEVPKKEDDARVSESDRSEEFTIEVGSESVEMESRVLEVKEENDRLDEQNNQLGPQDVEFDDQTNGFDGEIGRLEKNGRIDGQIEQFDDQKGQIDDPNELVEACSDAQSIGFNARNDRIERVEVEEIGGGSQYTSLLSEFDDFVAMGTGIDRAKSYGFEVGDMVWGKVKSHPWWPGHIFNEESASPSVRRTRREGFVLVAFFGDNSYGWFDPAELIPFDANFAEKSQQMNSRNFVKAVEEAIDESSRRRALGLACKCRNPYNFRRTNVRGYYVVDLPDYEPGWVYSAKQISKSRDSFRPADTISFIKQLALAPVDCDQRSLGFAQNKATVSSLRKAVFEEFDETYLEAFGVQATRPSRVPVDQIAPARAALSGPMVFAESLGGEKSSTKPMKVKDHSKKDKYILKRRDESISSNTHQVTKGQADVSAPTAYMEGSLALAAGDYVLQKRAPSVSVSSKGASSGQDVTCKEAVTKDLGPTSSKLTSQGGSLNAKSSHDMEKGEREGRKADVIVSPASTGKADLSGREVSSGIMDGSLQKPSQQTGGMSGNGGVKKVKVRKRSAGDLSSESSTVGERKKKKKKKDSGPETSSDHLQKHLTTGKGGSSLGKLAGKSSQTGLPSREDSEHQQGDSPSNLLSDSVQKLPVVRTGNVELELPKLLKDLQTLALDPFHGLERNIPAIIRQFFLQFRSLVYQKSLVSAPSPENEPVEARAAKSQANLGAADGPVRDLSRSKPAKTIVRPDDPTKAGRKRGPSDRQEEMAAKKLKKMKDLKSLAAEKKASQKSQEVQRREGKESASAAPAPPRPARPDSVKKVEHHQAKAADPAMLVMKFPPRTSLPSGPELKARFARFGPIKHDSIRVFWKSSTCRVVFQNRGDAQAACRYVNGNNSLFGNVGVRCYIREVGDPASEVPDSGKGRGDDTSNDTPRVTNPAVERPSSAFVHRPLQQPAVQLKSCLKKAPSEEAGQVSSGGGGNGGGRGTPRVKFMLGGEESSRGEQMMMVGSRNNYFNNNATTTTTTFADGGTPSSSTTSVAMDINSKNFQKVIPPSPSPLPPQFPKTPVNNLHHTDAVASRNHQNMNNTPTSLPSATTIDISQQMLSLLTRCNDVVTNVTGMLGYVPYHPL